jgi:hypothetical protein
MPIRVKSASCLECHSTPAAAPAGMLERYGTANGFGWRMDEVVGSQIVYVPAGQVQSAARARQSGDEIGQLARHFDFMAREVYSREERLQLALNDLTQSQARLVSAQRIAQLAHWDWDTRRRLDRAGGDHDGARAAP